MATFQIFGFSTAAAMYVRHDVKGDGRVQHKRASACIVHDVASQYSVNHGSAFTLKDSNLSYL